MSENEKDAPERERGWWEYRCSVCWRRAAGSTIFREQLYDYGDHCGQPWIPVQWISLNPQAAVNPREEGTK
jgi:hypothetical protein